MAESTGSTRSQSPAERREAGRVWSTGDQQREHVGPGVAARALARALRVGSGRSQSESSSRGRAGRTYRLGRQSFGVGSGGGGAATLFSGREPGSPDTRWSAVAYLGALGHGQHHVCPGSHGGPWRCLHQASGGRGRSERRSGPAHWVRPLLWPGLQALEPPRDRERHTVQTALLERHRPAAGAPRPLARELSRAIRDPGDRRPHASRVTPAEVRWNAQLAQREMFSEEATDGETRTRTPAETA